MITEDSVRVVVSSSPRECHLTLYSGYVAVIDRCTVQLPSSEREKTRASLSARLSEAAKSGDVHERLSRKILNAGAEFVHRWGMSAFLSQLSKRLSAANGPVYLQDLEDELPLELLPVAVDESKPPKPLATLSDVVRIGWSRPEVADVACGIGLLAYPKDRRGLISWSGFAEAPSSLSPVQLGDRMRDCEQGWVIVADGRRSGSEDDLVVHLGERHSHEFSTMDLPQEVKSRIVVMLCCHVAQKDGLRVGILQHSDQTFPRLLCERGAEHVVGGLCAIPTEAGARLVNSLCEYAVKLPFVEAWLHARRDVRRSALITTHEELVLCGLTLYSRLTRRMLRAPLATSSESGEAA